MPSERNFLKVLGDRTYLLDESFGKTQRSGVTIYSKTYN